jgi:hypothetical protein
MGRIVVGGMARFLQLHERVGATDDAGRKPQISNLGAGILGDPVLQGTIGVPPCLVRPVWSYAHEQVGGIFCHGVKEGVVGGAYGSAQIGLPRLAWTCSCQPSRRYDQVTSSPIADNLLVFRKSVVDVGEPLLSPNP